MERRFLDRLTALAIADSAKSGAVLETLTRITLRLDVRSADLEALINAPPGELQKTVYRHFYVRELALRNIGRIGGSEAIAFLEKLTPAALEPDESRNLWPTANIALLEARLGRFPDAHTRIQLLENILTEPHDAASDSKLIGWAVNQLCDDGVLASLPAVRDAILKRDSFTANEQMEFCEARMRVASSNPDRIKALASALRTDGANYRVTAWAIYQLDAIQSPEADAELDRYAAQIARIPDGSPARQRLRFLSAVVSDLQSDRRVRIPGLARRP